MERETIDATGIDKVSLVLELYAGTMAIGLGELHDQAGGLTKEQAAEALGSCSRSTPYQLFNGNPKVVRECSFDYVAGRPLKVSVLELDDGRTVIDRPDLYDRDAGAGACQRAVDRARAREGQ